MEKILPSDTNYYKSFARITKNITLDDVNTGEDLDCLIVVAQSQLFIDNGINLTIGEGKKLLIDLHDIY